MSVSSLSEVQHQVYKQATVLLVKHIGGEEDIPQVPHTLVYIPQLCAPCAKEIYLGLHVFHLRSYLLAASL